MDQRKQLAQRLSVNPSHRQSSKFAFSLRSDAPDHRQLRPRCLPSLPGKKPSRIEPVSPLIACKINLPARTPHHIEAPAQQQELFKSRASRKSVPNRRHRSVLVHGQLRYPALAGLRPSEANPFAFIPLLKSDSSLREDFWYLNQKEESYQFEFVSYEERRANNYVTISSRGVTYYTSGCTEFITLDEWEHEYRIYSRIKTIAFFRTYKKWKNFALWKNIRRRTMVQQRSEYLNNQLFFLNHTLQGPLLALRTQTYRIMRADLIDFHADEVRDLSKFNSDQDLRRERIADSLEEIEGNIKEVVARACTRSMEDFYRENRTTIQHDEKGHCEEQPKAFLVGDPTNKQMPFTQEAIIRTQFSRLNKFLKLCDYQIMDSKLALSFQSALKILETFSLHGQQHSKKALNPVFVVQCSFERFNILYDPQPSGIKLAIEDALMKGFAVVCNNELLISAPEFTKFTALPDLGEDNQLDEIDLLQMVVNDKDTERVRGEIKTNVDCAFAAVEEFATGFQPSLELYEANENSDLNFYRTAELEEFTKAIRLYEGQVQAFAAIQEDRAVGIYQLKATQLKEKLRPSPQRCLQQLRALMPELSLQRAEGLCNELNAANKQLKAPPRTVSEYIEYSKFLRTTCGRMTEFSEHFSHIARLNQIMDECSVNYDDRTRQKFSDSLQALSTLKQRVASASQRDEGDRTKFNKELRERIANLEKSTKEAKGKLQDDKLSDRDAQPGVLVLYLKDVGAVVEQLFSDSRDFMRFQEELELERNNFEHVATLKRDLQLKRDMWGALNDWECEVKLWNNTPFKEIDVEVISQKVDECFRVATRCKVLEEQGNFVPEVLRSRVETLKNTMPVVVDLRSPALLQRHWEQIRSEIAQPIDITQTSFTLQSLLDMKVNAKKEAIGEIALRAKKEMELERQLTQISRDWESVEFTVKELPDKDVYVLSQLDDLVALLDETQVSLTSIVTNRYVSPLYHKAEPLQKKFALFASTLDEWLNVQKSWLYLENILNSPDISKQLPDEFKTFKHIDANFKKLMRTVAERPLALQIGARIELFKQLQDYNSKLELIQKALERFLDRKRKQFPRFFFLSNDELLEILAQAKVATAVQPHLRKIFEAIHQLEFGENKEDLHAMISGEGEKVALSRNLKARGSVEEWLKVLEIDMVKSLKRELKEGLAAYEEAPRTEWLRGQLAQVVSCAGNITWTASTEEALGAREEAELLLSEWFDVNVAQLEELTHLVGLQLTEIERRTVVALVTQDVHNRDTVELLRTERVDGLTDFRWQQQLRYYFHTESEECTIKQVNTTLHYGYEYMGATTRLVITPLTDRC